jgi:carbonic anhydrase
MAEDTAPELSADRYVANNARYAETFSGDLPLAPSGRVAVVACMDARLDIHALLGLEPGEAHVIRNAGGVVTDDVLRSLAISQRLLGTREVVLVHHTNCGMLTFTDAEFRDAIAAEVGQRPEWDCRTFTDLDEDVRDSIARVAGSPFLPHRDAVRGFVFDITTGRLTEVPAA